MRLIECKPVSTGARDPKKRAGGRPANYYTPSDAQAIRTGTKIIFDPACMQWKANLVTDDSMRRIEIVIVGVARPTRVMRVSAIRFVKRSEHAREEIGVVRRAQADDQLREMGP